MADHEEFSIYETVRAAQPGLVPHVMHKPAILTLSRRLEALIAESPKPESVLFGSFQRDEFFRASCDIWAGLALRVAATFVFTADEPQGPAPDGVLRVPTPNDAKVNREWAILWVSPVAGKGFVARELEQRDPELGRSFETVRMSDFETVMGAARAARNLALSRSSDALGRLPEWFRPAVLA
jgi:hypothetical protein